MTSGRDPDQRPGCMVTEQRKLGIPISQTGWPLPVKTARSGRYVDLEPLSEEHVPDLWPVASVAPESFTYLKYGPFDQSANLHALVADLSSRPDQPFWVVSPKGQAPQGWLSICDVLRAVRAVAGRARRPTSRYSDDGEVWQLSAVPPARHFLHREEGLVG